MNFAQVIRELQLMYHAAARADSAAESFAHRDLAAALADTYHVPAATTDTLIRLAYENTDDEPSLYSPPDSALQDRRA